MTKYIVNYTRSEQEGFPEQKFEMPIEALDPSAAALIAGVQIFVDTLNASSVGDLLSMMGIDLRELGNITTDAFKDCVNVTVSGV